MSGRKKDSIWQFFQIKSKSATGVRAQCKSCQKELQGLVARLKKHHQECSARIDGSSNRETENNGK